jgi:protein-disulfide isomerase
MNCGMITSLGLILLALVAWIGIGGTSTEFAGAQPALVSPSTADTEAATPVSSASLCDRYPVFCVPLVGGGEGVFAQSETPESRDMALAAGTGVVRGISEDGSYFIGDPATLIRFKLFHNFGCPHCRAFYNGDLIRFIESYVATGKAMLEVDVMDFGTPPYPTQAAYGAMCAGEQGAYWEMEAILYERPSEATQDQIVGFAEELGLDSAALRDCMVSERYAEGLDVHNLLAFDLGVNATPTVLVSYGDGTWTPISRAYDNLAAMTDAVYASTGAP